MPHIASTSIATRAKVGTMGAEQLIAGPKGEMRPHRVKREVFAGMQQMRKPTVRPCPHCRKMVVGLSSFLAVVVAGRSFGAVIRGRGVRFWPWHG